MSDSEFNNYMTKFKSMLKVEEDGCRVWMARGFYGLIYPHTPSKEWLCATCTNMSSTKKGSLLRRITSADENDFSVTEDYDDGFRFIFHEERLEVIAKIIQCRFKRQLTDEQRKKLSDRAKEQFELNQVCTPYSASCSYPIDRLEH